MPAAQDGESESGFHRRKDWCGIEFSMLLFIPQNYRSNAAVRSIGHRSVLQRLMQCTALDSAAHCIFLFTLYTKASQSPSPFLFMGYAGVQRRVAAAHQRHDSPAEPPWQELRRNICNTRKLPAEWHPHRSWPVSQHLPTGREWHGLRRVAHIPPCRQPVWQSPTDL